MLALTPTTVLAEQDGPIVVATSRPLHALAYGVMQGVAKPVLLSPKNYSHHGGELRPQQLKRLAAANLVVTMGEHIDAAIYKFAYANNIQTFSPTVDNTDTLLAPRPIGVLDKDHHLIDGSASFDDHGVDIHIWLSPTNAISLTTSLADRLARIDADNAARYRDNAESQIEAIDDLDKTLRRLLEPVKEKPFVAYHDATQYLEYHYGLNAVASIATEQGHGSGARTIRAVRRAIADTNARCLFREPGLEPRLLKNVVEGFEIKIVQFDPAGIIVPASIDAWAQTMQNLAQKMTDCLSD